MKIPLHEGLQTYVDTPEEEVEHTAAVTLVRQEQAVASEVGVRPGRPRVYDETSAAGLGGGMNEQH